MANGRECEVFFLKTLKMLKSNCFPAEGPVQKNLNATYSECFLIKTIIQKQNTVFGLKRKRKRRRRGDANFVKSRFNIQLTRGSEEDECKVAAAIMFCF